MVLTYRVDCRCQDADGDHFRTQGFASVEEAMAMVRQYRAAGWRVNWDCGYWSGTRTVLAVGGSLRRSLQAAAQGE